MWEKASNYVKYLGIYLDEYLDWSPHINHLSHKLVKANAMLCKLHMLCKLMLFFITMFHMFVLHGVRI